MIDIQLFNKIFMKKAVIIIAIFLVVFLVTLVSVPVLFKGKLLEKAKSTISRNLDATVNFDNFNLSLIRNFPKASLSLNNVLITGKGSFQGDTLLYIASLRTKFGLFDLLSPDNLTLNELILEKARLNLLVNKANKANWDIIPESGSGPASSKESSSFGMELSKIKIIHGEIVYNDLTLPMNIDFRDVNMEVKGRMYGSNTDLQLVGMADQFNLEYDSAEYIAKTRLDLSSKLHINFETWDFGFNEGVVKINGLPLGVDGNFSMPGDSMFFDLTFASKASLLSDFLKLTPPDYAPYLKDLKAEGNAELTGKFKGLYYDENYPALQLLFKIAGGKLQYAGFPDEIKNINADMSVNKPQGSLNLTTVQVKKAHAEISNNPIDFNLQISNLMEDMLFSGKLMGKVNFDRLKSVLPMDSIAVSGLMDINIGMSGNMSAIENKNYGLLKTDGILSLTNFSFSNNQLSMPVYISSGIMDFSPEIINLQQFNMKIGQSDMSIAGSLSDYYAYLLTNGTLTGNFSLNSGYLNLNELMLLQKTDVSQKTTDKKSTSVSDNSGVQSSTFTVPERVNLIFQTNVKKALYEKLKISNINGRVTVNNGKLDLNGLNMNLLDGELKIAGTYEKSGNQSPVVNMALDLISFDIPSAFQSLQLIQKYIPIAAQSKGQFSTSIRLKGLLDQQMNLIPESLNGNGLFNSNSVQILNSPVFNKIKSVLNEDRLSDVKIDDFTSQFTIENGDLLLKPFKTKIADQDATFSGRLNANNIIDMYISFIINREALSSNIENTIAMLPGQQNIQRIPVDVSITGLVKNPDVGIDLTQAKNMVKKEVGNASKQEIKNTLNKVGQGIKKFFK
jgi:hypothetical protein